MHEDIIWYGYADDKLTSFKTVRQGATEMAIRGLSAEKSPTFTSSCARAPHRSGHKR